MNRLKEKYKNEIVPNLIKKHNYNTIMEVPKLEKIVVNMGVGDATGNSKLKYIYNGWNLYRDHQN